MSESAKALPFRFHNHNKKNQFLNVVQQKWFELLTENQTVLGSVTTGKSNQAFLSSSNYDTNATTWNEVAYDITIKKVLTEEDIRYIDLLAEYFNYKESTPGKWTFIFSLIIAPLALALVDSIFHTHILNNNSFLWIWLGLGILIFIYFIWRSIRKSNAIITKYRNQLAPYLKNIRY